MVDGPRVSASRCVDSLAGVHRLAITLGEIAMYRGTWLVVAAMVMYTGRRPAHDLRNGPPSERPDV